MKKRKQHGGPRPGSGRKVVDDKKVPLTIYVKESVLNRIGKENAKQLAENPFTGRNADEVWKELLEKSRPISDAEARKLMEQAAKDQMKKSKTKAS